jgi:small subunit ribosomal protein S18
LPSAGISAAPPRFLPKRRPRPVRRPVLTFRFPAPIFYRYANPDTRQFIQEVVAIIRGRSNRRELVAKLKKEDIDYKRIDVLIQFITPTGRIEAARRTGANRKQQAQVVRAVKRARYLGLLPYTKDDSR